MSAKSPKGNSILRVGQIYSSGFASHEILKLELSPYRDALGNNTIVTYQTSDTDEPSTATFLDFITNVTALVHEGDIEAGGLHEHHLLDNGLTIAVGQVWRHHKGDDYQIVDVSLDANIGALDFNQARISYRAVSGDGKKPTWNLSVAEFLKTDVHGTKRFTKLTLVGKEARTIQRDRSLRFLWKLPK